LEVKVTFQCRIRLKKWVGQVCYPYPPESRTSCWAGVLIRL